MLYATCQFSNNNLLTNTMDKESTTPTPVKAVTTPPFTFNYGQLRARLEEANNHLEQFNGKPNHNPHIYHRDVLLPLMNRLEGLVRDIQTNKLLPKETTKELHDLIMKIDPKYIPIVNPDLKEPVAEAINPVIPQGLKLPSGPSTGK